jgi:hypothetical protein
MKTTPLLALLASAALGACSFDPSWDGVPEDTRGLAQLEVKGLLTFLNNQHDTDFARLDGDCELRSDSAHNLIEHRDGLDGTPGTADDNLFESIAEIDDVYMVGQETVDKLLVCAESFGYITEPRCVAQPFDPNDDFEVAFVDDLEALDPDLAERVGELAGDAVRFADPASPNPIRFADVAIYTVDGAPVFHQVTFAQAVDTDGGVEIRIAYDLDACLQTTDINISI